MRKVNFIFVGLILAALTACAGFEFRPESAAVQELVEYDSAIPDSVRVHQSQPWQGKTVVLASYLSNEGGEMASCEAVFAMERASGGWYVSGSGIGCSVPPNTEAVTFGSGTQGVQPDDLSYTHGLVTLGAATAVEITWQDGVAQRVPVVNGSYLALRDGTIPMIARLEVLDATETVIHEIEIMPDVQKVP